LFLYFWITSKFGQRSKIEIVGKNLNFGQKSKFWSKILGNNRNLGKNLNCGLKSMFWPKIVIFGEKMKVLVKNWNFEQKSKFWSKIEILSEPNFFRQHGHDDDCEKTKKRQNRRTERDELNTLIEQRTKYLEIPSEKMEEVSKMAYPRYAKTFKKIKFSKKFWDCLEIIKILKQKYIIGHLPARSTNLPKWNQLRDNKPRAKFIIKRRWYHVSIFAMFRFLPKISIFNQNFDFWPKFRFLAKFQFLRKISIFVHNFNFWPQFRFFPEISIFET